MNAKSSNVDIELKSADWREVFAFDFRSVALFRILIGVMLLSDVLFRLPTLVAMYTDHGVITRQVLGEYYDKWIGLNWNFGVWSFHWLSGEAWLQYLLFAISAAAAIALIVGWKTRIATIVSWVLLASLHVRNPLILTSGDTILKLVLFWSMFLPLGRVWSLDARKNREKASDSLGKQFYSLATVGFLLQIILMYFFTGVAKCNEDWFGGEAMQYVLRLDIYVLPLGMSLLEYPLLLTIVTYATLLFEVIVIWFLLVPQRNAFWRLLNIVAYWGFHIGIGLTMSIGLFPLICLVIWIPLLPAIVWNRVGAANKDSMGLEVVAWSPLQLFSQVLLVVSIGFIVLINVANIDHPVCKKFLPRAIAPVGFWLNLDQRFQMFGRPPKSNPWFVYEATLQDKTQLDAMRNSEVDETRPENVRLSLPSHHWRKLHRNLVHPARKEVRQALVDYMVRDWNSKHHDEKKIVKLRLLCFEEEIGPDYDGISVQQTIWGTYEDPDLAPGSDFDAATEKLLEGLPF